MDISQLACVPCAAVSRLFYGQISGFVIAIVTPSASWGNKIGSRSHKLPVLRAEVANSSWVTIAMTWLFIWLPFSFRVLFLTLLKTKNNLKKNNYHATWERGGPIRTVVGVFQAMSSILPMDDALATFKNVRLAAIWKSSMFLFSPMSINSITFLYSWDFFFSVVLMRLLPLMTSTACWWVITSSSSPRKPPFQRDVWWFFCHSRSCIPGPLGCAFQWIAGSWDLPSRPEHIHLGPEGWPRRVHIDL